jgi:hypothetical protein
VELVELELLQQTRMEIVALLEETRRSTHLLRSAEPMPLAERQHPEFLALGLCSLTAVAQPLA